MLVPLAIPEYRSSTEIVVGVPRRDDSQAISGTNIWVVCRPAPGRKDNGKSDARRIRS